MSTITTDDVIEAIEADLSGIEERVTQRVHLADLIRDGAKHTTQEFGWGKGDRACALSAAGLAAKARHLL
jgi:hypothetical protein